MRPLVIDESSRQALQRLRSYAESHVIDGDELVRISKQESPPPGDRPDHWCIIPRGYRVVFSIDEMPTKQKYRHASFSVDTKGSDVQVRYPNPAAVEELLSHLGFQNKMEDCMVRMEGGYAINVVEPYRTK